jgi:hypothetical protein
MYQVSNNFKNAITDGGTWIVKGEVQLRGDTIAGGESVPIVGGSVSVDRDSAIRRRCTVVIADEDWVPKTSDDLLFPVGHELKLSAGFQYVDGSQELVPLGVFRITKPVAVRRTDGSVEITVDGYDRSRAITRDKWPRPYFFIEGTNVGVAIKYLINRTYPWLDDDDYLFMTTAYTTPLIVYNVGDDPWKGCLDLAASIGAEVFFNPDGLPVLQPEPDLASSDPCWLYVEGETCTVSEFNKDLDDEEAINGVIVTGMTASTGPKNNSRPFRAEAWDTDPNSETYFSPSNPADSEYGAVPYFIDSQTIRTAVQAQEVADATLRRRQGILQAVSFTAIPNPAHEASDVITITDSKTKLNGNQIMEAFNIDLTLGSSMSATTRERRIKWT